MSSVSNSSSPVVRLKPPRFGPRTDTIQKESLQLEHDIAKTILFLWNGTNSGMFLKRRSIGTKTNLISFTNRAKILRNKFGKSLLFVTSFDQKNNTYQQKYTGPSSFFQVTFWFPNWRSRFHPWRGHLNPQKVTGKNLADTSPRYPFFFNTILSRRAPVFFCTTAPVIDRYHQSQWTSRHCNLAPTGTAEKSWTFKGQCHPPPKCQCHLKPQEIMQDTRGLFRDNDD